MKSFDYSRRSRDVQSAHAELNAAFDDLRDRSLADDPRTLRWQMAANNFHLAVDRAYPEELAEVVAGTRASSELPTSHILDFLKADPMHFRSGYLKEILLSEIKSRHLSETEVSRLQDIMLQIVRSGERRREFRYYCRAVYQLRSEAFRAELVQLEGSTDFKVARRANWMLAALAGKFEEIARASRKLRWGQGDGWIT